MNFHSMTTSCLFNHDTTSSQAVTHKVSSQHSENENFLVLIRPVTRGCRYGRNFVVKCGGTAWCEINIVIRSIQKYSFINTGSQSCLLEVF